MNRIQAPNDQKGLLVWFANNSIAANLLMVLIMLCGLVAAWNSTIEIFPEIDPRTITVNVPYPGSTPEEVEESINRRVEEAITGIDGIQKVRSVAAEGAGAVTAELEDHVDDREVLDDVKSAVEQIQNFPPEDAEEPSIEDTSNISDAITIALYGQVSERTLRELAYRVRDDITAMEGISIATVKGVRNYEISIELSEDALRKHGLRFDQVVDAVRNFSINLPGGTIRTEQREILLRTNGQAYRSNDFGAIVLRSQTDGAVVRLRDVGVVKDGFEATDQVNLFNGQPAVFVAVSRVGEQQVLNIEERVKEYVDQLALPKGLAKAVWSNRAEKLRARIGLLVRNGLMGLILVFAVLVLFLNLRLAFWTTMGIPISFLGAFLLTYTSGASINMVSLFAFILVLGVVVDDAIIVGENVFAKREQGLAPLPAAIEGLKEVIAPVCIGILTTILAFIPLLFTTGILGQILWVIPVIVISVLFISLLEACFILPAHLASVRHISNDGAIPMMQQYLRRLLQRFIVTMYMPVLKLALKWPYVTVAAAFSIFMLTVGTIKGGYLESVFFPQVESDSIAAKVRMPSGTTAQQTELVIRSMLQAAEAMRQHFDKTLPDASPSIIRNMSASVGFAPFSGRGGPAGTADSSTGANFGEVKIELLPSENRTLKTTALEANWRSRIGEYPGAEITFKSTLMSAGDDINVELSHANFEQLLIATNVLKRTLKQYQGVVEVKDSFEPGKPELQLAITSAGVTAGLTLNDLARQVRQAFYGAEAQRVQRGRDDIKVMVRYPESKRRRLATIYNMRIRLASGEEVPFKTVAKVTEDRGYATIERADRRRIVTVSAKVDANLANANQINDRLRNKVLVTLSQDIPGLFYSFEGAEKERMDSMQSLSKAMLVALIAIFSVLAVQLKSYTQPLIIMSVIPMGFVGAAIGHWLLGYPVSFFSVFGLVALSGVVVNDSVILLDLINRLRAQGMPYPEAIITACQRRFRAIFFTTLTTCAGLGPIITETSTQAQFLIPMAISLAFGVAFATLITLVLVPALCLIRSHIGSLVSIKKVPQPVEYSD